MACFLERADPPGSPNATPARPVLAAMTWHLRVGGAWRVSSYRLSESKLDGFTGKDHSLQAVLGLTLGIVHGSLPASENAASATMDLNGDPMSVPVLADEEAVDLGEGKIGRAGDGLGDG